MAVLKNSGYRMPSPAVLIGDFNGYGEQELAIIYRNTVAFDDRYYWQETVSMTAGPLTGRVGSSKLIEDIAISWANITQDLYIIPTELDSNGNFKAFGDAEVAFQSFHFTTSFEAEKLGYRIRDSFCRVGIATGDFSGNALILGDPVHQTKSELNKSSSTDKIKNGITAYNRDALTYYTSPMHIWCYPILNKVLPQWYKEGKRLDYGTDDINDSDATKYITFTMYGKPERFNSDSLTASQIYQPLHEEGNFFSYPSKIEDTEGYNEKGLLDEIHHVDWTKNTKSGVTMEFTKAEETMEETDEHIEKSELSENLSAIHDLLGSKATGDLASNIPPYTDHHETFSKSYTNDELIDVKIMGKSTLPETANNTLSFAAYVAKEGTMKVATAVELAILWREGSLYHDLPDPSLYLPKKFWKNGSIFSGTMDDFEATEIRGMRFYLPDYNKFTDSDLLNGLSYQIRVPLYNASFKGTGNFKVRLSRTKEPYVAEKDMLNAEKVLIGETTMSIGGWVNSKSDSNKGWHSSTGNRQMLRKAHITSLCKLILITHLRKFTNQDLMRTVQSTITAETMSDILCSTCSKLRVSMSLQAMWL